MVIQSEPTPYAKYRLRHYGYNSETGRNDYEDVKVRPPTLQTTVTFGEGLKTPSDLFGSLKKAGQRFVGAEKLVQGQFRKLSSSVSVSSGHSRGKCQCRHHQKKLLQNDETHENNNHNHKLSAINENDHVETQEPKGHTLAHGIFISEQFFYSIHSKIPLVLTFTTF